MAGGGPLDLVLQATDYLDATQVSPKHIQVNP